MKVGIVTITDGSNYGNNLQNYAVIKVLKTLGVESETIKTDVENSLIKKIINKLKRIINNGDNICVQDSGAGVESDFAEQERVQSHVRNQETTIKDYVLREKRAQRFKKFSKKYLNKSREVCIEREPSLLYKYDCLVFGSDQIWNFTISRVERGYKYFSGMFAYNTKKIAYSASVGVNYIPDKFKNDFANSLKNFSAVSVREQSGKSAIEELIDIDVKVTIDPTLMLNRKEWLEIARKPKYIKSNKKYIMTYFLGDVLETTKNFIVSISKKYDYEIVNITMDWVAYQNVENKKHFCTSPDEFVWLVSNCELMLTDSFHACVFSIIMDKPFRVFKRQQKGLKKMNSRIETLASVLELDNWYIGNCNEELEHILYKDYKRAFENIEIEKKKSFEYLKGSLI